MLIVMVGSGLLPAKNLVAQTDEGPLERLIELLEEAQLELENDMAKCPALFVRVSPERPPHKSLSNATGWVLISLTVTTTGEVKDQEILTSSLGSEFDEAALEAVANYKFRPWVIDKRPIPFENWVERIDFLLDDEVPSQSWPDPKDYFDFDCDE